MQFVYRPHPLPSLTPLWATPPCLSLRAPGRQPHPSRQPHPFTLATPHSHSYNILTNIAKHVINIDVVSNDYIAHMLDLHINE